MSRTVAAACLIFFARRADGRHLQQEAGSSTTCPDLRELTVEEGDSSDAGVLDVFSALIEAGQCAANNDTTSTVRVDWAGSVQTTQPFSVPAGVELRVDGRRPWYSTYLASHDTDDDALELDDELESVIADAAAATADPEEGKDVTPSEISSVNGTAGLFVVEDGGSLHLSNLTLSGASASLGGGAVRTVGGEVTAEGIRWASLTTASAGGAVHAYNGASINLSGLHLFQGCSASTLGGGAVYAQNASCSFLDGAQVFFEGCSAGTSGGGLQLFSSTLDAADNTRTRFRDCSAADKGGGLYTKESVIDFGDNASLGFHGCASGDIDGAKGGGICSYESTLSIGGGAEVIFSNNSSPVGDGGGLYGQETSLRIGGGGSALLFRNNRCGDSGGGIALEWSDANESAGCLVLSEGSNATFSGNSAVEYGGGAFVDGCEVTASGAVAFRGNTAERAGALYIIESAVSVPGDASFVDNSADRWGGAVYLLDSREAAGAGLRLTGGVVFSGNTAVRSGGGIYIENGDLTMIRDDGEGSEGGLWTGNTAGYDGGVVAVDGGGVWIEGGLASENQAAQRGGVLFATGDSELSWGGGGETWSNLAAAGGAMYVSSSVVNLTDLRLAGDCAPTGSNVFLASANVRAVNVSVVAPANPGGTFALYVDSGSAFRAFAGALDGWEGEAHAIVSEGTLVLDAWDFRGSGITSLVQASGGSATIRNAVLGDNNFASVGFNASAPLGDGVNGCASLPPELSCAAPEECADNGNGMGVLCPAFTEAATFGAVSLGTGDGDALGDGGSSSVSTSMVELGVVADAGGASSLSDDSTAVYYPSLVVEELTLRHASREDGDDDEGMAAILAGAGGVLWELRRTDGLDSEGGGGAASNGVAPDENGAFPATEATSADNFTWTAVPWTGFLVGGQEVTIRLVGTPPPPPDPSYPFAVSNGEVGAEFRVVYRTASTDAAVSEGSAAAVASMFYYCGQGDYWDGGACVSCAEEMAEMSAGEDALDCSMPGVTLDTLPLAEGYWRGDITRTFVRECLNPSACIGGRGMDTLSSSSSSSRATSAAAVTTAVAASASSVEYDETRYCVEGHKGAFCAVCANGYRRMSAGQLCVSCEGGWSNSAKVALWLLVVAAPLALVALVVFLVGGPPAVLQLKDILAGLCCCRSAKATTAEQRASAASGLAQTRSSRRIAVKSFGTRLLAAIPFQKLKILIVVWQILTQFSHLAEIPYPPSYQRFLNLLDVFSFDITWPLNATCLVGNISFYQRLLGVTLGPLVVLAFLCTTYAMAMAVHRSRPGRASSEARQRAVVRHASAALLVLFLVFSSVSTTVFSTYACDYVEDLEVSLLRADYSISCDHPDHVFYEWYAALMIFLYPIGIPALFAVLLLNRRDKINPPILRHANGGSPALTLTTSTDTAIETSGRSDTGGDDDVEASGREAGAVVGTVPTSRGVSGGGGGGGGKGRGRPKGAAVYDGGGAGGGGGGADSGRFSGEGKRRLLSSSSSLGGGSGTSNCFVTDWGGRAAAVDREEMLESRAHNPDLQSTRFLWEPYEPDDYYYETVECGRRCLLTGALVFVLPNTAGQAAGACVFAFASLLAFELLRPHLSHTDGWMYRMGCIVVFFSNFLALMAKADVSDEEAQSQETFGLLLIAVHAAMVIAVVSQAYLSMQATSESRDDVLESFLKKSSSEDSSRGRNDTSRPPDNADGRGGKGDGRTHCRRSSAGAKGKAEVHGGGGEGGEDGRPVMWKHDGVGHDGRDDGGGGGGVDGHGDDGLGPMGAGRGWEDVEWPRWGRNNRPRVTPSVFSDNRDDHTEDSVELESVYSQRSKKTNLVAGALGRGLPHWRTTTRERHNHGAPGDGGGSSDIAPSSLSRSTATGSVFPALHNGRVQSVNNSSGGGGGGGHYRERNVAKGHVVRRSTGGWGMGGGGGGGGGRDHKRADSVLSSSLSPVRHVRRSSAGTANGSGGCGGGRVTDARRTIGQRTGSARQLGSDRYEGGGVVRVRRSSTGAAMEYDDGAEDTTASKLERLHSLSRRREGGAGGSGTPEDFPAPPKLAVTVSEGVARASRKRPSKKGGGGHSPTEMRAPASGDALSSGAPAKRGRERGGSDFAPSEGTFV